MTSSLYLLALLLFTQPRMLALFAARALCWLPVCQDAQGLFSNAVPLVTPLSALLQGACLSQVHILALAPVDFQKVSVSTFLQPV